MNNPTLREMLELNPQFQQLNGEQKAIYGRLADEFYDNDLALYLSPKGLAEKLMRGNKQQWEIFLRFPAVEAYIKAQMAEQAKVASRRAMQALGKEAALGDVQAARQVNELAGVLASADSRKIVVLHQIARPKLPSQEQEVTNGTAVE
jgi:hypothetical protein